MKREELNWAEYCSRRSEVSFAIHGMQESIRNPDNWEWVNEFNTIDTDGTNYYIHFGFVHKKVYYGKQLVFSMPTDYKLKDNSELMYHRKLAFIKMFSEMLMNEEFENNVNLVRSEMLTPYEKKPYAVGGNV